MYHVFFSCLCSRSRLTRYTSEFHLRVITKPCPQKCCQCTIISPIQMIDAEGYSTMRSWYHIALLLTLARAQTQQYRHRATMHASCQHGIHPDTHMGGAPRWASNTPLSTTLHIWTQRVPKLQYNIPLLETDWCIDIRIDLSIFGSIKTPRTSKLS